MKFVNLFWSWPVAFAALVYAHPVHAQSNSEDVRITFINGQQRSEQKSVLVVEPGDVVEFKADVFRDGLSLGQPLSDFTFTSTYSSDDECDASNQADCLEKSNFDVDDDSVNYYVPYDLKKSIKIRVRSHTFTHSYDVLVLRPSGVVEDVPTEMITRADDYRAANYTHTQALVGWGNWVIIEGERYWVPNAFEVGWTPYRSGYWVETPTDGLTWVSYDPWGWVTDHYGVWRRHHRHGWVWLPFDDCKYRPHTVTFINRDNYVGWYPYYSNYNRGYRHGYREGFEDGFEAGYRVAEREERELNVLSIGFTLIEVALFTHHESFHHVRVHDDHLAISIFRDSYRQGCHREYLGGRNWYESRDYIHNRMHANLPVTVNNVHITNNNITIVNTRSVYERPRHIQDAVDQRVHEGFRRPKPVGAIVKPAVNPHDAPQIIRRSGKIEAPHKNPRPEMKPLPQPEEQPRRRDDRKPIEQKPVEQKPVVRKPIEQKPIEQKPVVRKPIEQKPIEQKPVVRKPIEQKPIEQKPVVRKPIEQKPIEQKPVVRKPIEQKPVEQKPVVRKPIEQKPSERKIERRAPAPVSGPSKKDDEKKEHSKKKG